MHFMSLMPLQKGVSFNEAIQRNRICSGNLSFVNRFNNLESWILKRRFSEKMMRKELIRSNSYPKEELLEKMRTSVHKN